MTKNEMEHHCKRGSAAMVRNTCCSYGKGQIMNLSRAETTLPINTKFWTIDYEEHCIILFRLILRRAYPHVGEMHTLTVFSSCFVDHTLLSAIQPHKNSFQTKICNGIWRNVAQKTSFGVRTCLLSIRSVKIEGKGVKIPKLWLSREIPAIMKTSENTI